MKNIVKNEQNFEKKIQNFVKKMIFFWKIKKKWDFFLYFLVKKWFVCEEYFPLKIAIGICIWNFVKNIHPWKKQKKILFAPENYQWVADIQSGS